MIKCGKFITFEGVDGVGKTTHATILTDKLRSKGHNVVLTREPGGTNVGEGIRKLLADRTTYTWLNKCEILLLFAARYDHYDTLIKPALSQGKHVICDRFIDSTRVYQTVNNPEDRPLIEELHNKLIGQEPDLTLILSSGRNVVQDRVRKRVSRDSRFENMSTCMIDKLITGFEQLQYEYPNRCKLVETTMDPLKISVQILNDVLSLLE